MMEENERGGGSGGMGERTGRCLSIQQPWAWLIVNGHKAVENRDWPTKVVGWIGIHAGKRFDRDGYEWVRRTFPHIAMPEPGDFPMGGVVGRARLVGCVHERDARLLSERDRPWFFGAYGFVLDSAEPLPLMPCRGALGFFRPDLAATPFTPALPAVPSPTTREADHG